MRELHVVALSDDGKYVVLATSPQAGRGGFRVALDSRLAAAMRGELPRPGQTEPPNAAVTPREIQARLRAGESAEQIAASAGVPLERVERFSGPVLAERTQIVQAARAAVLTRGRRGPSAAPLGESVDTNMLEQEARPADADWTARRLDHSTWLVEVHWSGRGRRRRAAWRYDPTTRAVVAADPASAALGYLDPDPDARATVRAGSGRPGAAAVRGGAARGRTVVASGVTTAKRLAATSGQPAAAKAVPKPAPARAGTPVLKPAPARAGQPARSAAPKPAASVKRPVAVTKPAKAVTPPKTVRPAPTPNAAEPAAPRAARPKPLTAALAPAAARTARPASATVRPAAGGARQVARPEQAAPPKPAVARPAAARVSTAATRRPARAQQSVRPAQPEPAPIRQPDVETTQHESPTVREMPSTPGAELTGPEPSGEAATALTSATGIADSGAPPAPGRGPEVLDPTTAEPATGGPPAADPPSPDVAVQAERSLQEPPRAPVPPSESTYRPPQLRVVPPPPPEPEPEPGDDRSTPDPGPEKRTDRPGDARLESG